MLSMDTITDLNQVIDNIDNRINSNIGKINPKELEYLAYQKVKIQQLIDDIHRNKGFFTSSNG